MAARRRPIVTRPLDWTSDQGGQPPPLPSRAICRFLLRAIWLLPSEPISIRIAAAVKLTGIGRSTLYEMINAGEIETAKIGRSTFIRYASLKRLFERS